MIPLSHAEHQVSNDLSVRPLESIRKSEKYSSTHLWPKTGDCAFQERLQDQFRWICCPGSLRHLSRNPRQPRELIWVEVWGYRPSIGKEEQWKKVLRSLPATGPRQ